MKFFYRQIKKRAPAAFKKTQLFQDHFAEAVDIAKYEFGGEDIKRDIQSRYQFDGDLLDIYVAGSEQLVHKWHHYIPVYDRYFSKWRGKPVRFLEIGVSKGGSLSMWRKYFGDQAIIFGVDIDEDCAQYDGIDGSVRIGSQDDPAFLQRVVEEMGGIDLVLDDGSHIMRHIRASLEILLPKLDDGGIYMIEDLHTSYWNDYGGGFRARNNFFNFVREMIDDMHHWYHVSKLRHPAVSAHCNSIHIHDSICVFEKSPPQRPVHLTVQRRG